MFTSSRTGTVLADITLPDNKHQLVYLDREGCESDDKRDEDQIWNIIYKAIKQVKKQKHLTKKEEDNLAISLHDKDEPRSSKLKSIYEECKTLIYREEDRDIYGKNSEFTPLFVPSRDEEQCHIVNIVGRSGAGKSSFVNKCLRLIKDFTPKSKFFIFSRKSSDPELEKGIESQIIRIECNEAFESEPLPEIEDFAGTEKIPNYLIFDDYEKLQDPTIRNRVRDFLGASVEICRQLHINIFIVRHEILNGVKSRNLLSENTNLVIFPNASPRTQVIDVLTKKIGLSIAQVQKIMRLKSRWVSISTTYPMWICYENGMYML